MSIDTEGNFYALPKCGIIEVDRFYDPMASNDLNLAEVCFFWKEKVSCYAINGAVLFNNIQQQIAGYRHCIVNDAIDKLCGFEWTVFSFDKQTFITPKSALIGNFEFYGDYYIMEDNDGKIRNSLIEKGEVPK